MYKLLVVFWITIFGIQEISIAQLNSKSRPTAKVTRVQDEEIQLDGVLSESVWLNGEAIDGFKQREPFEGEKVSFPVIVFVSYSDEYLYLAAKIERKPEDIQAIISRRDNSANSERLIFSFDTYLDRITSYSFGVTASGVRLDYYHPSDTPFNRDYSWNPVWEAKTSKDSSSWYIEAKIPFSQLRFNTIDEVIFGLNINYYIPDLNEDSFWIPVKRDEVGWASHFGDLTGFGKLKQKPRIELLPYYASDLLHQGSIDQANPFDETTSWNNRIGADIKFGLGSNLTVDATINPDFGQVEADPANVNLSQFEIIQGERRPFFTEGSNLFSGGGSSYFYSRRIGSSPSLVPDADYVNSPQNTTILSAAKITGRLKNGTSIGFLSALTSTEYANTFDVGTNTYSKVTVEPLASYNVLRVQQEFGQYGSKLGLILTGVKRDVEGNTVLENQVTTQAFTGGMDWAIRLDKRKYELYGNVGFSHVEGSEQVISKLQKSSARNYQRPDIDYLKIDTTLTSLFGYTTELRFAKVEGNFLWSISSEVESPGFELNDIGAVQSVDEYNLRGSIEWRELNPSNWYNQYSISSDLGSVWNYGHVRNGSYSTIEFELTTTNFASFRTYYEHGFGGLSDDITRGGPLMKRPSNDYLSFSYNSNRGVQTRYGINASLFSNTEGAKSWSLGSSLSSLLGGRWEFSLNPSFSFDLNKRQYIDQIERLGTATFGKRYIFSSVERYTFSLLLRTNFAVTPDLSLEFYAEPFSSNGKFSEFGELAQAKTNQIRAYGTDGTTIQQVNENGLYVITDGAESFEVKRSDFKVLSFRSNVVIRYEWIPGSTLFLVWQQSKFSSNANPGPVKPVDIVNSFSAMGDQYIAFKISYWLPGSRLF